MREFMGRKCTSTKRYVRQHPRVSFTNNYPAVWTEVDATITGWFVGCAFKQNGHTSHDDGGGSQWIQKSRTHVCLICTAPYKKPVPVPFAAITFLD